MLFRVTLAAVVFCTAATAAAETDRQSRTIALPAARAIVLQITVGQVRIEGSDRSDAEIDIVRHAPTALGFARIPVVIDESETTVRIRVSQADGQSDPALRSDVTLRVPRGAVVREVRIAEGRLTLSSLHGAITADLRRGPVEATDLRGAVRLETGIGDITVDRAGLTTDGVLRLRTFNGDVRLTLSEKPPDARIMALALNGTITSDIPLTSKDTWGPRWGETTLGNGQPVISLDVINGRIEIRVR